MESQDFSQALYKKAQLVHELVMSKQQQEHGSLAHSITEMLLEPHRRVYRNHGAPLGDSDEAMVCWFYERAQQGLL